MATWRKALIVNLVAIIGAGSTLLVAPPSMSFWLWLAICFIAIAIVNYFVLFRGRKLQPQEEFPRWKTMTAIGLFVFFILDILYSYYHKQGVWMR
jgi:hypothetical protein